MYTKKIGDLATYINGYAFKPSDWGESGLPIVRIQDLTGTSYQTNYYDGDYPKKIEINNGDVLISWSASLGVYVWDRGKALLNQHIFKVVFDKEYIDKNYFVYAIKHSLNKMTLKTHGATMKHIVKNDFYNIEIPYPNRETQIKMSKALLKVENVIEYRKQQLEQFDLLIKSRFVEMFGDIQNSKQYPYLPIKSFTNVISGGTPSRDITSYWRNGTIRWVKTTELQNSVIEDTEEKITQQGLENSSAKIVPAKTILIAMYGQGKTRGMTGYLAVEAATNQACACILPSKKFNSKYLWQYMIMSYNELRNLAKGGNQPNLNGMMIKNFCVLMPPIELQNEFVQFVDQVEKSKTQVQKSLDEAQLLFNSLMQEYFG